ncbi:MAG: hypothetical protein WEB58_03345 [Planctomycetaceae bacterium]|jgi:hypothetical protein
MSDTLNNIETFRKADEIMRIARSAVRKARAESRRLGVANVFWRDGIRYFELPNGEITRTPPDWATPEPR